MKCPHCEYKHGWDGETLSCIKGEHGEFFRLPIDMERDNNFYGGAERRELLACPSCNKTFID